MESAEAVSAVHAEVFGNRPSHATPQLEAGCRQSVRRIVFLEHQVIEVPHAIVKRKRSELLCAFSSVDEAGVFIPVLASVNTAEDIFPAPVTLSR